MESKAAQQTVFLDASFRQCDLVHSLFMKLLRTPGMLVKMEIVSGNGNVVQDLR